jgi:hypothetical protein
MELSILLCASPPNWFIYASGFASIIAFIALILYFIKPCLCITDESDYNEPIIRIKCVNRNFFRNPILDVKCDIVASRTDDFLTSDTLELNKDWVPGISFCDNYLFKVKIIPPNFDEKKYLKVRILVVNVLGIRKLYKRVYKIQR